MHNSRHLQILLGKFYRRVTEEVHADCIFLLAWSKITSIQSYLKRR